MLYLSRDIRPPLPAATPFQNRRAISARGGGGVLPSNRLMGMCRWMGSRFHDWIGYNGVPFSIELLEWGCIFSGFGSENILASREFGY